MNIEKMIGIVCQMIAKESGVDIMRASNITSAEVNEIIIRRTLKGEKINSVIANVKKKYVLDKLSFEK